MRIKEGFILRKIGDENAIMGEGLAAVNFGRLLALNDSAAWLWKEAQAQGDFTIDSLVAKLCEEYDVSPDEARRDITEVLTQLKSEGVIE